MEHFEVKDLLVTYRNDKSTAVAEQNIVDTIITPIHVDNKYNTAEILCNLTEAFDVIDITYRLKNWLCMASPKLLTIY